MNIINFSERTQVAGGSHGSLSSFLELVHVLAGGAIGVSLSISYLKAPVLLFGLPIPLQTAGALIGGSVGHILYNLEDITTTARTKCLATSETEVLTKNLLNG